MQLSIQKRVHFVTKIQNNLDVTEHKYFYTHIRQAQLLLFMLRTQRSPNSLRFVYFLGRPWQATDVPQPSWLFVPPALDVPTFGHQMPPHLPTRSTLQRRKLELMGGE
jgi:hypothetical protein